jgi:hypothetical protein
MVHRVRSLRTLNLHFKAIDVLPLFLDPRV